MDHAPETRKAATAAASFSLMLLRAYYSDTPGPVSASLKMGLLENKSNGQAWDLIQEFADDHDQLSASAADMAARNPLACVQLGEIFASALVTGADDSPERCYLIDVVPAERKSGDISLTLQTLSAPILSRMFRPG